MTTVYTDSFTAVTDASSGPLDVSAYHELWLAFNASDIAWLGSTQVLISRIDAHDTLHPIVQIPLGNDLTSLDIGAGLTLNQSFGDSIQIDISCFVDTTATTTISVIGK